MLVAVALGEHKASLVDLVVCPASEEWVVAWAEPTREVQVVEDVEVSSSSTCDTHTNAETNIIELYILLYQ